MAGGSAGIKTMTSRSRLVSLANVPFQNKRIQIAAFAPPRLAPGRVLPFQAGAKPLTWLVMSEHSQDKSLLAKEQR
jgi:hypothetical protein